MRSNRFGTQTLIALIVIALLAVGTASAFAATGWRAFGSGWSVNRGGDLESPQVDLHSVTKKNPTDVRFKVTNHAGNSRDVLVDWKLDCWKKVGGLNDSVTKKANMFSETIGAGSTLIKAVTFDPTAEWCKLEVKVEYDTASAGSTGKITLKYQAKY